MDRAVAECHGLLVAVGPGERVLHPVHVVAVGEVLAGMGAAAFLAGFGAHDRGCRLQDEVLEFQRLDQVAVPHQRTVGDADVVDAVPHFARAASTPCASVSPVRKTAASSCMIFCMRARSSAVGVPPVA